MPSALRRSDGSRPEKREPRGNAGPSDDQQSLLLSQRKRQAVQHLPRI
jgi:hypothetical protein